MSAGDPTGLRTLGHTALRLADEYRRQWLRARVGGLSAEIAFFALLGLFPAVIVFAAALGSLDVVIGAGAAGDVEVWLLDRVEQIFGADNTVGATVADLFGRSSAGVITIGAALTLYASSRGFIAVVRALDVIYGHQQRRRWLSARVTGLAITVVTVIVAALVTAMAVIGPLLGSGEEIAERFDAGTNFATAWVWFRWPVMFVIVVAWAASVYHFAPKRQSRLRRELPGAVAATVWWLVVSTGFRAYLSVASGGMNTVFGVLGGALSLVFWLYLLAMGLLAGATLNSLLAHRHPRQVPLQPTAPAPPTRCSGLDGTLHDS